MSELDLTAIAPAGDPDSAFFWEALGKRRLLAPRCRACGRIFFPPMPACPHCASADLERVELSGRGRVYSWVTVHVALDPLFRSETPYTIVTVALEEEPTARIFCRLLGDTAAELGDGVAVRILATRLGRIVVPGAELDRG